MSINKKVKKLILVGASAIYWALWLSRNDIGFDKTLSKSYLQVLFRETYWLRGWARLESTIMNLFANFGWRFSLNRI